MLQLIKVVDIINTVKNNQNFIKRNSFSTSLVVIQIKKWECLFMNTLFKIKILKK